MKYLIIFTIGFLTMNVNAEDCTESQTVSAEQVVYSVSKDIPKHLKGATITITQADGKTSTVPSEKFMVVPRKQTTILGENKTISKKLSCSKPSERKNIVSLDIRNDVTDIETKTTAIPNGQQASVKAKTGTVLGLNLYRRELFDTRIGAGAGLDANGVLKGTVGLDF